MRKIIVLLSLLCLNSCVFDSDGYHKSIEFSNNSDKTIYVDWGFYPDMLYLPIGQPKSNPSNVITPNTSSDSPLHQSPVSWDFWEAVFYHLPNDTLYITVYNMDTIVYDHGRGYHPTLIRYELTPNDVEFMEWHLSYPPSENMRHVKIWPIYEWE